MTVNVKEQAAALFSQEANAFLTYFAPGRVNLIGEHTDYNGGYVFPAALTKGTYLAISKRNDQQVVMKSAQFDQTVSLDLQSLDYDDAHDWANYPKGILREFVTNHAFDTGLNFYFHGNIPNGAGLSSSASICLVTAYALNDLFHFKVSKTDLAFLCQRVENNYIGVNSGIMDQFAVAFGKEDHALFLNCETLEKELIPLTLGAYQLVISNTNKRRGLADSKYNERRSECDKGLKELQQEIPTLQNLSDVTIDLWKKNRSALTDPTVAKRVEHVVQENARVVAAVQALKTNDLEHFGKLMIESHESLRDLYEVTGNELDTMFDLQKKEAGCLGTRMTGAGFGGCTVSIVHKDHTDQFIDNVTKAYEKAIGWSPEMYVSNIGDGVKSL
ncbi:galactokinase [Bacillaceae bacterium SIJ1]|uniref:galactokinase n=1 Tax=Litoribacterium kuwaitense TaxID=1398745 RepID=UPI0013ED2567|nr:galactokinase [Litoribacterium kuwaitense]NGP43970.1 galactokinase [Litoribacterium kuwaitense]